MRIIEESCDGMKFDWQYDHELEISVLEFLRSVNLPRRYITRLKFHGGDIQVNGQSVTVRYKVKCGDMITVIAPDELGHETVPTSDIGLDIVYEDRDLLIVNKPINAVSIPSRRQPDTSIANRIKGYYESQNYPDKVIHIVTRLDRDTSGLMLIAKHRLAHAWMDQQIQNGLLEKFYFAISHRQAWPEHGFIEAPIARNPESIISRCVDQSGQAAKTEYWLEEILDNSSLLRLKLHTGRTHQIRVHCAFMDGPLVGDDLYGGTKANSLMRQALHCGELKFVHPFSGDMVQVMQPIAKDMENWIEDHRIT